MVNNEWPASDPSLHFAGPDNRPHPRHTLQPWNYKHKRVATLANHQIYAAVLKSDSGIPNIPRGFQRALKSDARHRSSTAMKFGGQLPVLNFFNYRPNCSVHHNCFMGIVFGIVH